MSVVSFSRQGWTRHRFMWVGINSFIWKLSLHWWPLERPQSSIFLGVQTLSGVGVWMFMRQTWQSDAPAALSALCPASHSAVFGEQGTVLMVQWLHSSIPQVLSGRGSKRLLKSTLETTELKGNGVLIVMWFFIRGCFAGLSWETGEVGNQLPKGSSVCHADKQRKNTGQPGRAARVPTAQADVNTIDRMCSLYSYLLPIKFALFGHLRAEGSPLNEQGCTALGTNRTLSRLKAFP